jgi:hypothetical protein
MRSEECNTSVPSVSWLLQDNLVAFQNHSKMQLYPVFKFHAKTPNIGQRLGKRTIWGMNIQKHQQFWSVHNMDFQLVLQSHSGHFSYFMILR